MEFMKSNMGVTYMGPMYIFKKIKKISRLFEVNISSHNIMS